MRTKKFLQTVVIAQLVMLALVGLEALGLNVPGLRQIIGFIYLTFIPGLLILRAFRLSQQGAIETLLYSVGLSLAFIMFLGLFMNTVYPLIGISKPISILPIAVTLAISLLTLGIIAYKRRRPDEEALLKFNSIRWSGLLSPPVLFLLLLPLLAILGNYLSFYYESSILLLIFLALVALAVGLVAFNRFIPSRLYPVALISIGIALLWHKSLTSPGLIGSDIHLEYYLQNLVITNSVWDSSFGISINGMLSIVMLAPIYSIMLNLDTVWIFKVIYPVFYCLMPLALFQAFRQQTNDKIAFFAAFVLISGPIFFSAALQLAREQLAELFLALTVLLLFSKRMPTARRAPLLIIFGLSMVVSHYGVSYIYVIYLLLALPLLFLLRKSKMLEHTNAQTSTLSVPYVSLFIVSCLGWYMYVASGNLFLRVTHMGSHIYNSLTELLSTVGRQPMLLQALGLAPMRNPDIEWEIARIFQYIIQLFIVVGVAKLIFDLRKTKLGTEYIAMILASAVILLMSIILPFFAKPLGISRIYHLTLFFLAPFCILGGMEVLYWLAKPFRLIPLSLRQAAPSFISMVVILVLIPYFLFMSGFIFEVTGATPSSQPMNPLKIDWTISTQSEIRAREWLGRNINTYSWVYGDNYGTRILAGYTTFRGHGIPLTSNPTPDPPLRTPPGTPQIKDSYVFLRRWNVVNREVRMAEWQGVAVIVRYADLDNETIFSGSKTIRERSKIYDNGQAQILGP